MSGKNKVNPDHYKVAGRLSPDDLARERRRQPEPSFGATRGRQNKPLPPWMVNEQLGRTAAENIGDADAAAIDVGEVQESAPKPPPKSRPNITAKAKPRQRATGVAKPAPSKSSTTRKAASGGGPAKRATSRTASKSRVAPKAKNTTTRTAAKRSTRTAARKAPRAAATTRGRKATTKKTR